MLLYIITLYIITVCNSAPRTETFSELVLVQRFAATKTFYEDIFRRVVDTNSEVFVQHLKKHKELFLNESWVLHGLWALDSNDKILTRCEDSLGTALEVDYDTLDKKLSDDLKAYWPVLTINGTEKEYLEREYSEYGSCVAKNGTSYFEKALGLLQEYNMKTIFRRAKLYPASSLYYSDFIGRINSNLSVDGFMSCVQAPLQYNRNGLYLLLIDIHLCFNVNGELNNCPLAYENNFLRRNYAYACYGYPLILYPAISRHYHNLLNTL